MHANPVISFIIPAFNEQKHLSLCLNSIKHFFKEQEREIIVIDNGSTDDTVIIAEELGAQVIINREASIARMRNLGAEQAVGDIFIFLDADIELTEQWFLAFNPIKQRVLTESLLTGSQAAVPSPAKFIEKYWFEEFYKKREVSHLGSAHLITSKNTFNKINGFNEALETGEDYDFCQRAKSLNIIIENNIELKVIHYGFPNTLRDFIKRESWHGKGDLIDINTFLQSKVAITSVCFLLAHLGVIFGVLANLKWLIGASIVSLVTLLALSTWHKYAHSKLLPLSINFFIYYFYFSGRVLSIFIVLFDKVSKQKTS
ncbi:glycosyltransferase [Alteromonas sp. S167]|uniref:glycosyltransferase n=1 Tax=Alteromonas sp. S167 TaxID=3117402 RepID=UPI002FE306C2